MLVPCDFSQGMLRVGKRRRPDLPFVAGDATRLPFADGAFDAVTICFGLRNVVDPDAALREMLRVTRHGGRIVVCEFSQPVWQPFRTVYTEYLMRALPAVARRVARPTRSPTSTSPSRSGPGPDQRGARRADHARPAGREVAYRNLSAAASSPCTAPSRP